MTFDFEAEGDVDTSKEALKTVDISKMQARALLYVKKEPDSTGQEIQKAYEEDGGEGYLWKRLPELERKGLIVKSSHRPCRVTERRVWTWKEKEGSE